MGFPLISFADALQTERIRHGYVKCRLVHMRDRSFVMPDILLVSGLRRKFYSPQFFSPNQIAFFGDDGSADFCSFTIDVLGRAQLKVAFFRRGLVKKCADGSFLYKCAFTLRRGNGYPPPQGKWRRRGQKFELALFHHTNSAGRKGITASKELWSSPWNIQGGRKLKNIGYGYFTCMPRIEHEAHLKEIAMSSDGRAHFLPTNAPYDASFAMALDVPRQTPLDRDQSLCFWVDVETIAPSHLWLHRPMTEPAYYEIVLPKVYRVGVVSGQTIPIKGTALAIKPEDCKSFGYAIVGDADSHDGLAAPYHEEETLHLAKIDLITGEQEIIGRWYEMQNSRLFGEISVELVQMVEEKSSDN